MKNWKENEIQKLIDSFMEGETTNEQEQELYSYFRREEKEIPESLLPYREMFQWYEGGMQSPTLNELEQQAAEAKKQTSKSVRIFKLSKWWTVAGIAASLALVAGAGFYLVRQQQTNELYEEYAGSYIIRDGRMITDLAEILPELKQAELEAEQKEEAMNLLCQSREERIKQQMLDNASSEVARLMINELFE